MSLFSGFFKKNKKGTDSKAEILVTEGDSLARRYRDDKALKCYDRALEINPQLAVVWVKKGGVFYILGRFDEAVKCYDRALEINSQHADTWHSKGKSLVGLSRYAEAVKCYDRALEINPQDASAWFSKGVALDSLGCCDEAAKCYDRAAEICPLLGTNKKCSICGGPLTFRPQYQRWYCYRDQKYA